MSGTLRGLRAASRLVIQQDGPHHRFQIAPDALPVVIENGGDAIEITRARVARHQPLNQLPANKRPDIRMIEDRIEGGGKVLCGRLSSRDQHTVQDCLGISRVMAGHVDHRVTPVGRWIENRRICGLRVGPTRKDRGRSEDRLLVVGRNRQPDGAEGQASIKIEMIEADREQLHDLTGVVFVRQPRTGSVCLIVLEHVEISPHRGIEGDVLEELAKIPKGAIDQDIIVGRERSRLVTQISGGIRNHQDFTQSEGNPLSQLVGSRNRVGPPGIVRLSDGWRVDSRRIHEREMRRGRRRKLVVQESVEALALDGRNQRRGRAKGCLRKKSTGISNGGRAGWKRRRRCWSRWDLPAPRQIKESRDFSRRKRRGLHAEIDLAGPEQGDDVRNRIRSDWSENPEVGSVGLWNRRANVEQDRAIRGVNAHPCDGTGEVRKLERKDRGGSIAGQPQAGTAGAR